MGYLPTLASEGFQRASGKPFGAPAGAYPLPRLGPDAPTTARMVGLPPREGSTFFRSERKYQRKHAARRLRRRPTSLRAVGFGLREPLRGCPRPRLAALTRRKKASTAHFDGGARYVARSGGSQLTPTVVRARSSPFSAVKMGGPFSLRCLSPPCPGAVGGGHTQPLQGGM